MFRNVVVGISGGVDSSVAALLLKRQGYNVNAVFMKNWDQIDETGQCSGESDWKDAQWICNRLKIPLLQVNFVKEYWNEVFGHFLQDYECGITPNPDILCNRHIKFNSFYQYARKYLKADAIATGHYACSSFGPYLEKYQDNTNVKLLCANDIIKDQTFFLSQVPQEALRRTMFPLGELQKCEVKKIATTAGLDRIARKKESTGICFVGKRNFHEFISEYIDDKPGNFINFDTGQVIGRHNGMHHWTVGQRCGAVSGSQKPFFILRKLQKDNSILLVHGTDHRTLYSDTLYTSKPIWIDCYESPARLAENKILNCSFRFQHTKPLMDCLAISSNNGLLIKLRKPLRALTPGQYAVFYKNSECLGSARITAPGPSVQYSRQEFEVGLC